MSMPPQSPPPENQSPALNGSPAQYGDSNGAYQGGPNRPASKRSNAKWWVLGCTGAFLVFVVLPLIALFAAGAWVTKGAVNMVQEASADYSAAVAAGDRFVRALENNDPQAARAAANETYRATTPEAETATFVAETAPEFPGRLRVVDRVLRNRNGVETVELLYGTTPETSSYLTVTVVKEQGQWLVSQVDWTADEPAQFSEPLTSTTSVSP